MFSLKSVWHASKLIYRHRFANRFQTDIAKAHSSFRIEIAVWTPWIDSAKAIGFAHVYRLTSVLSHGDRVYILMTFIAVYFELFSVLCNLELNNGCSRQRSVGARRSAGPHRQLYRSYILNNRRHRFLMHIVREQVVSTWNCIDIGSNASMNSWA
jgi:hypothetical protein